MRRRRLVLTLLPILLLQMLAGFASAAVCVDPCPEEEETQESCPPVCALCASCAHAQLVVPDRARDTAFLRLGRCSADLRVVPSSHPADDIFHVPLLG